MKNWGEFSIHECAYNHLLNTYSFEDKLNSLNPTPPEIFLQSK